jgi:hypothetical protein
VLTEVEFFCDLLVRQSFGDKAKVRELWSDRAGNSAAGVCRRNAVNSAQNQT